MNEELTQNGMGEQSDTGPLRVGTRASLLARTQSETVAAALREALGREVVLVEVTTEGDVFRLHLRFRPDTRHNLRAPEPRQVVLTSAAREGARH